MRNLEGGTVPLPGGIEGERVPGPRRTTSPGLRRLLGSAERIVVDPTSAGCRVPPHIRRLFDKVLIPFHHACDQRDFEVAEKLLRVLEMMVDRDLANQDGDRRRTLDGLVAAHERLWSLRHPTERYESGFLAPHRPGDL